MTISSFELFKMTRIDLIKQRVPFSITKWIICFAMSNEDTRSARDAWGHLAWLKLHWVVRFRREK